jgi:hypothetical protein
MDKRSLKAAEGSDPKADDVEGVVSAPLRRHPAIGYPPRALRARWVIGLLRWLTVSSWYNVFMFLFLTIY